MSTRWLLQVAAGLIAPLVASAAVLAADEPGHSTSPAWRVSLEHAEAALARGDTRTAEQAWETAFRRAMASRSPQGMLDVGHAYLRIGEAAHRPAAVARARRLFLAALFQARGRRDANRVVAAAEAFAALGDRDVAGRACDIAQGLALQNNDRTALERVVELRSRLGSAPHAPNLGIGKHLTPTDAR